MTRIAYNQHRNNQMDEHKKVCPPQEISSGVLKAHKERNDPKFRKTALCLGCGNRNSECARCGHLKPHYPTMINQSIY